MKNPLIYIKPIQARNSGHQHLFLYYRPNFTSLARALEGQLTLYLCRSRQFDRELSSASIANSASLPTQRHFLLNGAGVVGANIFINYTPGTANQFSNIFKGVVVVGG